MAYEKHNFEDGNVLHAADLNAMEDQIAANETAAGAAAAAAAAAATAAEGAVQKMTDEGTHVYGHNGQNQTEYTVYVSPTASTIPYRTSGGRVKVGTPTEDNDAATKAYVDARAGGDTADFERRLNALYELTQGQAWDYEKDTTPAHSKQIPSGARMASVNAICGRSFKWNQMFDKSRVTFRTGTPSTVEVSNSGNVYKGTILDKTSCLFQSYQSVGVEANHVYWCCCKIKATSAVTKLVLRFGYSGLFSASTVEYSTGAWVTVCDIRHAVSAPASQGFFVYCDVNQQTVAGDTIEFDADSVVYSDLTATFGAGNEPTTVDAAIAAYKALGIDITQPQPYDAGSIKHTAVTAVVTSGKNLLKFDPSDVNRYVEESPVASTFYGVALRNLTAGNYTVYFDLGATLTTAQYIYSRCLDKDGNTVKTVNLVAGTTIAQSSKKASFEVPEGGTLAVYKATGGNRDAAVQVLGYLAYLGITHDDYGYAPYTEITQPIPSSVLALPGYGWSAGTASNRIYREGNKWWYQQQVGSVDLDTKNIGNYESSVPFKYFYVDGANVKSHGQIISLDNNIAYISPNGSTQIRLYYGTGMIMSETPNPTGMLYYELAAPTITDITDYMINALDPTEVEAGGSITFVSESGAEVPNEVEYLIKLSEVVTA